MKKSASLILYTAIFLATNLAFSQEMKPSMDAAVKETVTSYAEGRVNQLDEVLKHAKEHGSQIHWYFPTDYQEEIKTVFQMNSEQEIDNFVNKKIYAISRDLNAGYFSPSKLSDARIAPKKFEFKSAVDDYIASKISVEQLISTVTPKNLIYLKARALYKKLKLAQQNGLLSAKPEGLKLLTIKLNVQNPELVSFFRNRLNELGYSNDVSNISFDSDLESLVKLFQKEHNLKEDGVVGPENWSLIDRSVEQLLVQAVLNLERARWLPNQDGGEFIYVNFNNQKLEYYKNNIIDLESKVIIGRTKEGKTEARKTPLLVDYIKNIVLNTKWTVPMTIFTTDKLPLLRSNPVFIKQNNMYVESNDDNTVVDPYSIDWNQDPKILLQKYSLVQKPGKDNALGRMKFFLSNKISIYLHDTNQRELFQKNLRLISSGCVRVEKPFDLAERVMSGTKWSKDEILKFTEYAPVQPTEETWIKPTRNIPVYFMSTSIIESPSGRIISLKDHYGIDTKMYSSLTKR